MEIAAWTFIIVVLMAVFKTLNFEKTDVAYYERKLLKRYLEIKKINPNHRVKYLKKWELSVIEALEKKGQSRMLNIVKYDGFSRNR